MIKIKAVRRKEEIGGRYCLLGLSSVYTTPIVSLMPHINCITYVLSLLSWFYVILNYSYRGTSLRSYSPKLLKPCVSSLLTSLPWLIIFSSGTWLVSALLRLGLFPVHYLIPTFEKKSHQVPIAGSADPTVSRTEMVGSILLHPGFHKGLHHEGLGSVVRINWVTTYNKAEYVASVQNTLTISVEGFESHRLKWSRQEMNLSPCCLPAVWC